MRILNVFLHYPVCSGRYVTEALQRLGHDVRHIGDSTGHHIWNMEVNPQYAYASDGGWTAHWSDWTPDLVLLLDSAFAYHHPVYASTPHVVYGVDNHVRDYRQFGIEHYFLAHKAVSVMNWQNDMTWLPCGYDDAVFTPSPIAWQEREYDVALVGVIYPQRAVALGALMDAGLNVFWQTGLLYDEMATAYHNARVSLCVSAAGDLAQRVFETAACGCAVVSDRVADLESIDKRGMKGIVCFDDMDDVVMAVKQALVAKPPQLSLRGHTWQDRAQVIIDWFEAR